MASPVPTTEAITQPINATAETEAADAACEAIGMRDGKLIPLTFSKEKWAAACGLMDQSYWYGFIDGCAQQIGYTEVKCIRFVKDVMENTFH